PGGQVVDEVRAGSGFGDGDLGAVGEAVSVLVEPFDEATLERGVGEGVEDDAGFGAGTANGAGGGDAAGEVEEEVAHGVAVDAGVVELVAVGKQAVVAGLFAALAGAGGVVEVFA